MFRDSLIFLSFRRGDQATFCRGMAADMCCFSLPGRNVDRAWDQRRISEKGMSSESEVYSSHLRAFSELLIRLRSELGNVLDNVLILAVTAERLPATIRTLEDPDEPAAAPATARKRRPRGRSAPSTCARGGWSGTSIPEGGGHAPRAEE